MREFFQPPPDPIDYRASTYYLHGKEINKVEVPKTLQRDWAIRTMMEQSVSCDDETVLEITKILSEQKLTPLEGSTILIDRPFIRSSPGHGGSNNEQLCEYAYHAYDVLDMYFIAKSYIRKEMCEWSNWFIAPYFAAGDDTRRTCYLGIFVDEHILETVVE